jgi:hypothetical protein
VAVALALAIPGSASASSAWQQAGQLLSDGATLVQGRDQLVVAPDGTAIALVGEEDRSTGAMRYVLDTKPPGAPVERRVLQDDGWGLLYGDLATSASGTAIAVWPDIEAGATFAAIRPPHGSFGDPIRIAGVSWEAKVAMNDRGDAECGRSRSSERSWSCSAGSLQRFWVSGRETATRPMQIRRCRPRPRR